MKPEEVQWENIHNIAIIGASDTPDKPVNTVGQFLIQAGFTVFPVHPKRKIVWGLDTFSSILHIPHPIDIVDVFRAPELCQEHALECLKLSPLPKIFWMQLGISSEEATDILANSSVNVIQNACVKIEYAMKRLKSKSN